MLLSPCKNAPASVSDAICNQIWSPYLNWVSIEGKRFHIPLWCLRVHLIRTTSADYSAVLLQECVRELSWPNRPMNKEKKYLPVRSAVNFPVANSWLLPRYSIVQYRMGWKYLSDLFPVAFGVIRIDTIPIDAALTGVDTWITSGREKFRILLFVIPPTVGGPVQFQWSVVTVVLSAHCWILPYE